MWWTPWLCSFRMDPPPSTLRAFTCPRPGIGPGTSGSRVPAREADSAVYSQGRAVQIRLNAPVGTAPQSGRPTRSGQDAYGRRHREAQRVQVLLQGGGVLAHVVGG